jgi:addiction module HigA family antidote
MEIDQMLPKYRTPTHPGEILAEEFLKPMGMSQSELARHLGWKSAKINEIVNEKRGITPASALLLSDAFGVSAEFWLNLQSAYDLSRARSVHKKVKTLKITPKLEED